MKERSGISSPPQAVTCVALCLAHVTTASSAVLLARNKILQALLPLSGLLNVCIDQMESVEGVEAAGGVAEGDKTLAGAVPGGGINESSRGELPAQTVLEYASVALWGCLSRYPGMHARNTFATYPRSHEPLGNKQDVVDNRSTSLLLDPCVFDIPGKQLDPPLSGICDTSRQVITIPVAR